MVPRICWMPQAREYGYGCIRISLIALSASVTLPFLLFFSMFGRSEEFVLLTALVQKTSNSELLVVPCLTKINRAFLEHKLVNGGFEHTQLDMKEVLSSIV
eukprot:scpid31018/ scgid18847/ 